MTTRALTILLVLYPLISQLCKGDENNVPEFQQSPARFFLSKQIYNAGRILDYLNLDPINRDNHAIQFRCTYLGEEKEYVSLHLFIDSKSLRIESVRRRKDNLTEKSYLITNPRRSAGLEQAISELKEDQDFWEPLSEAEDLYFSDILGGRPVLFELSEPGQYSAIALVSLFFDPPPDVDFLRELSSYKKIFTLLTTSVKAENSKE